MTEMQRLFSGKSASRARYGLDAPNGLIALALPGFAALTAAAVSLTLGWATELLIPVVALFCIDMTVVGLYLYTSRRGKHRVWAEVLESVPWQGDERGLDLGCGRGAVLIALARRLPRGHVTGVDIWDRVDQSGNAKSATERNVTLEGVADHVTIETADVRDLPFPAEDFDVVTSSLVLHNLPTTADRHQALENALRVLRPGGRFFLLDIRNIDEYKQLLHRSGAENVAVRDFGLRAAFGAPWLRLRFISCTKSPSGPAAGANESKTLPTQYARKSALQKG